MRLTMILAVLLLIPRASLGAEPRVEYIVRLDRAKSQLIEIETVLTEVDAEVVDLVLPVWRPGRYEVLEPAGTIRRFHATDGEGNELAWSKRRKNAWQVRTAGAETVRVTAEIYANSIRDRTRHADSTHAFLSGSSVFFWWPERRGEPARVRIEAPEGWRVATGLEPEGDDPFTLIAPNYDILVDSPIEVGELELLTFEVDGARHEIAIWGEGDWDADRLVDDFRVIVEECAEIFGDLPFERYVFQLHVGDGLGGGTEHYNSTIMQTRPSTFEKKDSYQGFLGLVSHEFFHTWNVKRLRPAGITPYDYERENYTKLLWVAEGTTSYYDDLILARGGLIDESEYLKRLGGSIDSLSRRPGRFLQSLEESSFDSWIKFSKRTPDTGNTTVSFYSKGALVSMLLDLEMRRRTGDRATLDGVMRDLYLRHPLESGGFRPEDVIASVERTSGEDFGGFFEAYVSGVGELDYDRSLAHVGLELEFKPNKASWGAEDDSADSEPAEGFVPQRVSLGLSLRQDGGRVLVRGVQEGGSAFEAGVIVDDELVAIDGRRVQGTDLSRLLDGVEIGDRVELLLARRGAMLRLEMAAGGEPDGTWTLTRAEEPTDAQRASYEAWVGQPWDADEESEADPESDED